MSYKLERNYIWECDYGIRKPLIEPLKKILRQQDANSLQMVALFVNNNPYYLEFYMVFSYDKPQIGDIELMLNEFSNLGMRYRPDITFEELIKQYGNRRFNNVTLVNEDQVDITFESGFFEFVEKNKLESMGYRMEPLGDKVPVFLSHSSKDKPDIEDLIPYLTGAGLPIWYDKINIDYGDSIINEIQSGIKKSGAVIFWITSEFLSSSWCKQEMDTFISILIKKDNIRTICVLDEDIDIDLLPLFLQDRKFLRFRRPLDLSSVANEIIPSLKKHFGL